MRIVVNNSPNSQMLKIGRHEIVLFPFSGIRARANNHVVAVIDSTTGSNAEHISTLIKSGRLQVRSHADICGLSTLNVAKATDGGIIPLSGANPLHAGIVSEALLRRDFPDLLTSDNKPKVVVVHPMKQDKPESAESANTSDAPKKADTSPEKSDGSSVTFGSRASHAGGKR